MKNLKKKEDLPPDIRHLIILIALGLLIVGCRNTPQVPNNPQVIFSSVALRDEEMGKVNQNSFVALGSPLDREKSLGSLTGIAKRIMHCESGGNPTVCNQEYGCRAGIGLYQLIPSTVKYCEEKLGRDIDPFNADDNTVCAMYLLENEGTRHWGYEGASWGSWSCWHE